MDCSPPVSSVHRDFPDKNTGVGCHALLQEIFLSQGSNPGLLHWRHQRHQGSSIINSLFSALQRNTQSRSFRAEGRKIHGARVLEENMSGIISWLAWGGTARTAEEGAGQGVDCDSAALAGDSGQLPNRTPLHPAPVSSSLCTTTQSQRRGLLGLASPIVAVVLGISRGHPVPGTSCSLDGRQGGDSLR